MCSCSGVVDEDLFLNSIYSSVVRPSYGNITYICINIYLKRGYVRLIFCF